MKALHMVSFVLLVVGGLNWGLVGLGELLGGQDWNIVSWLLGAWPSTENAVYVLVGLSALVMVATHKKDCKTCSIAPTDAAGI